MGKCVVCFGGDGDRGHMIVPGVESIKLKHLQQLFPYKPGAGIADNGPCS
jgi:hypothetical protein